MKKWNITKLVAAGSLGVLLLVLNIFGSILNTITGTTVFGGLFNTLFYIGVMIICLLIINQFGAAIVFFLIYGILVLPFNLFGPPGFILKIPIALIGGLIGDILYLITKKRKTLASIITGSIVMMYFFYVFVFAAKLFNIPGQEYQIKYFLNPAMNLLMMLAGAIFGYGGYLVYNKIKNTSIVKRIQR